MDGGGAGASKLCLGRLEEGEEAWDASGSGGARVRLDEGPLLAGAAPSGGTLVRKEGMASEVAVGPGRVSGSRGSAVGVRRGGRWCG